MTKTHTNRYDIHDLLEWRLPGVTLKQYLQNDVIYEVRFESDWHPSHQALQEVEWTFTVEGHDLVVTVEYEE